MAVVESYLFSRMRGSIGSLTMCQNFSAAIVARARIVNPLYPDTVYQEIARYAFNLACDEWTALSESDRLSWNHYGQSIMTRKPFGSMPLGGRYAFIQTISFTILSNFWNGLPATLSTNPPTSTGYLNIGPIVTSLYTAPASTGLAVSVFNPNPFSVICYHVYSAAYNTARNKLDGPFLGQTHGGFTISSLSTYDLQRALPGAYDGKAVFLKMKFSSAASPFKSSCHTITRHIAVTNP